MIKTIDADFESVPILNLNRFISGDLQVIMQPKKSLGIFKLTMMTVVAIDSLKNLPTNAQYGADLVFYYTIALLVFFIPSALVSAELATTWPVTGGIYIWVREAFGKKLAFLVVWMQFLIAITWYPTILSFIAATFAYLFAPELTLNKGYIFIVIQILFWLAAFLIGRGLHISSLVSSFSAIIGVIVPMLFFIALGLGWLYSGHQSSIHFAEAMTLEKVLSTDSLRLFITLLYSLMGMEIIAGHASEVSNPQKNYPRAILLATCIIIVTVIPASLAIAMVISPGEISLTSGVIEAFTIFLTTLHLNWLSPFLIMSVVIGCFGIFFTWFSTAARCLGVAANDGSLPLFLRTTNRHNMPMKQLMLQGLFFTVNSSTFLWMPSLDNAFWFLSAAAAQFALLYYVLLFAAALRLRYKHKDIKRPFRVGKHPIVIWLICGTASGTCLITFAFGFLPPPDVANDKIMSYEMTLSGLILAGLAIGWIIYHLCQPNQGLRAEPVCETAL